MKTSTEPSGRVDFGRLVGTHGVRGELKLRPHNPASPLVERLESVTLTTSAAPEPRTYGLTGIRPHRGNWLVWLEGVDSLDDAELLVGATLWIDAADLAPLAEGQFYYRDLVGLEVVNEEGEPLGHVKGVIETGAAAVLELADGERERLVPMTDEVVRSVDVSARRIVIRPLPGLFDV
ncbi:MAG: ribosome maturation factor RimM [Candidatus Binatia bacterium]